MPKASSRPSLPASSSDFALHPSPFASTSSLTLDDPSPLFQRFRRPSLLSSRSGHLTEARLHSPLASSFTLHSRRRSHSAVNNEESESDKERMLTDSSASSVNSTPPLKLPDGKEGETLGKSFAEKQPSTPPRRPSTNTDMQEPSIPTKSGRRLSFPIKQPRILSLLAESRPEEVEVKSEAAFQRLISSFSELPTQPHTPKVVTDRGRYPEEVRDEEPQREDTPSDDEETTADDISFLSTNGTEPTDTHKVTPVGSVNGDDLNMSISENYSTAAMDVDQPLCSPSTTMPTSLNQWRHTPPPVASVVRSNKRKLDDRYDPYSTASKRRAVSPSISYLRENHPTVGSPISARSTRLPIAIPVNLPGSNVSSATSSPTIPNSFSSSFPRSVSVASSPTLRATIPLASPILRPVVRMRKGEEDEREIEGAGEAVNGLRLG